MQELDQLVECRHKVLVAHDRECRKHVEHHYEVHHKAARSCLLVSEQLQLGHDPTLFAHGGASAGCI